VVIATNLFIHKI